MCTTSSQLLPTPGPEGSAPHDTARGVQGSNIAGTDALLLMNTPLQVVGGIQVDDGCSSIAYVLYCFCSPISTYIL
jgi:hypothetical protein